MNYAVCLRLAMGEAAQLGVTQVWALLASFVRRFGACGRTGHPGLVRDPPQTPNTQASEAPSVVSVQNSGVQSWTRVPFGNGGSECEATCCVRTGTLWPFFLLK